MSILIMGFCDGSAGRSLLFSILNSKGAVSRVQGSVVVEILTDFMITRLPTVVFE